ncbi:MULTISPECIES: 3'-hydroxymethylcephem-O-carbamoyltransferase [Streptomycetaceae]|uniref:3'-hydroxymethylcephem-O-carbamoyltransferase n=2 Tax=Streptantibioticus cattleyicolor (strain ATCC 35852 / DSM 46488 / JCM 4925 / NBRC 14057 / NRRL 8057) TaxID=1003195 RepID=F8JTW3_STREN|nr:MULTISPECIES: 3'-hydroxymethylcephem-O-carbamoyltransferase [Streptomycetaceae]AEW98053.1 3'-hydroxymethylcephem-O-carbamoyltransferase [Streptantibioticus cattleyicolor NRRL 8057 = DSM 46488]MYS62447.1 3-hydroxymethylcephem carbamoyltransferase [Streptomyces sp. SID5468]CCB78369.1 3'-hydroxymethylcephem-O-carbamoyltransferase [Streptantibioticus cattleyicolor NRRL 8057 = DSM 46488]
MLVVAFKPGHDGAVAAIGDRTLLYSLESEKDSRPRYTPLLPATLLDIAERLDAVPDVVALGGWADLRPNRVAPIGAGYEGVQEPTVTTSRFFGKEVRFFSSTHERSHIYMALGMAPRDDTAQQRTVLVWEGDVGAFYLVGPDHRVIRTVPVMTAPGARYSFLFGLADPTFPATGAKPRLNDAGKLMALAAFGDARDASPDIRHVVERILKQDSMYPAPKSEYQDSVLYNAGVQSPECKTAAALLTERLFETFARAAREHLPAGGPLYISGGCGLNCDWNSQWAELGHFSSVFVAPCTNDSGSALGTAIDALTTFTGDPHIEWSVYSGLDFVTDTTPDPARWRSVPLDDDALAAALASGRVVAWVQGRWEIGPRALGNRSLLAEPFGAATRDRLNAVKQREDYRPIAPVCRVEDLATVFHEDFEDPHMLYFRRVRAASGLRAVTHVDGSARVQTVRDSGNPRLHRLLTAFAARTGVGALCNTSLNFNGEGFINRMSDLTLYCESRGIDDMVVGETWYRRVGAPDAL